MIIYLLISVACTIKQPAKTFSLNCKPKTESFYFTEQECKSHELNGRKCIPVRIATNTKGE